VRCPLRHVAAQGSANKPDWLAFEIDNPRVIDRRLATELCVSQPRCPTRNVTPKLSAITSISGMIAFDSARGRIGSAARGTRLR
jgi:hypothetical protein